MDVRQYSVEHVSILPLLPGTCPVCATSHDPALPHNRDSLYYQMRFQQKFGRFPSWADAMSHCDQHVRAVCMGLLTEHDISPDGIAEIVTKPEDSEDGS